MHYNENSEHKPNFERLQNEIAGWNINGVETNPVHVNVQQSLMAMAVSLRWHEKEIVDLKKERWELKNQLEELKSK